MDNASFCVKSGHAIFEFFGSLFLGQEAKTVNSPRNFRKPTSARAPALVGSGIGRLLLMCVIILALAMLVATSANVPETPSGIDTVSVADVPAALIELLFTTMAGEDAGRKAKLEPLESRSTCQPEPES